MAKFEEQEISVGKIVTWAIVVLVIFLCLIDGMYTIGPGQRGIVVTFGNPSQNIAAEGLHFKVPLIQGVVKYDTRTQTVSFDNMQGTGDNSETSSLFAASKDLQDVQIATVVNYHIDPAEVRNILMTYGTQQYYNQYIIEPIIRETVKTVSATYTAEELVDKRAEFSQKVQDLLSERMDAKDAILEKSNIVNFQFSPVFTQAIENKVTAQQNALAAQNKLEQVKFEAQQTVAAAQAQADALRLQKEQVTPELVQLRMVEVQKAAVERWNGVLPVVTGGSTPFIQFSSLTSPTNSTA